MNVTRRRRAGLLLMVTGLVGGLMAYAAQPAQATPAKIPDGAVNFYIQGGGLTFGTGAGSISQSLSHLDTPPECSDGIDNETGTSHNGQTGDVPRPLVPAADAAIDFGSDTACVAAGDNSEMIDRNTRTPDPAPACGSEGAANTNVVGCANASFLDAATLPGADTNNAPVAARASSASVFNNTSATGQNRFQNRATGGTVAGSSVTVPQANVQFARGYQMQGQCQNGAPLGWVCLDFLVEFSVTAAGNVTGVTNADGSGTVSAPIQISVRLSGTYGSTVLNFFGTRSPYAAVCRTPVINLTNMTTETSGALTGVRYDDFRQNFKAVLSGWNMPAFAKVAQAGTLNGADQVCPAINTQIGLPDADSQVEMIMTTQTTSNTTGSSDSGTGMASFPGSWRPVAATEIGVNGGAMSSPTSTSATTNVNEGDLVNIRSTASYDPGMRTFTTDTLTRTGGTASAPPYTSGAGTTNQSFVAQDAPSGGATNIYTGSVAALLGPSGQSQADTITTTINVQNVAPTANAGPASRSANGGQNFTLAGTSTDPGDPDTPGVGRGYCWTETGGTLAGSTPNPPACSGSPANNGKQVTIAAPNTSGTLTYSLVVCDKDGGCSAAANTTVNVVATTANQISGTVRGCAPGCSAQAGLPVALYRDSTGFVGSTVTDGSGAYSFPSLAAASDYRVRFGGSGGWIGEWWNDAKFALEGDAITSPSAIVDADIYSAATSARTISGTATKASGGAASGVAVRLYNAAGFAGLTTTDGSGNYSLTLLQPGLYKVDFAKADATLAETWWGSTGNAYRGQDASNIDTTSASQVANVTLLDKGVGANGMGQLSGTVTATVGGAAISGIQARAYDSNGRWAGTATTDGSGNFSFTNAYGSNVTGLPPGSYKLWWWNSAQTGPGGGQVWCSEWFSDIPGGQFQGSGKFATSLVVTAGATTTQNATLDNNTSANCPK